MVDVGIQYRPEKYFYTNVRPIWKLPLRLGLADLFFTKYSNLETRIIADRIPSKMVKLTERFLGLKVPDDQEIFRLCFFERSYRNSTVDRNIRKNIFEDMSISDKGRYLQGLFNLFGSVFHADHILRDPFWRPLIHRMITDSKSYTLTYDQIKSIFPQIRRDQLKADPNNGYWKSVKKFDVFREQDFYELLEGQIFLQGTNLRCIHCFTDNWFNIDQLKSKMQCGGCLQEYTTPPKPEWSFKLNSLISNALVRQGIWSVIDAFAAVRNRRLTSEFSMYIPSQNIYKKEEKKDNSNENLIFKDGRLYYKGGDLYSDIDLIQIIDGKLMLGEVKTHAEELDEECIRKMGKIAEEFIPDELLFCAPGNNWPSEVNQRIDELTNILSKKLIKVVRLEISTNDYT